MYNEEARKAYIRAQFDIKDEIKKLQAQLDEHNARAEYINWAHVGDMNHILNQLKQLNGTAE